MNEVRQHTDWPAPALQYGVGELHGASGGYQWLRRDNSVSDQDLAYLEPRMTYAQPQDAPRLALYALTDRRLAAVRCRLEAGSDSAGRSGAVLCEAWIWPVSQLAQVGGPSAWLAYCLDTPSPPIPERPPVAARMAAEATSDQVWTVRQDTRRIALELMAAYLWIPDDLWTICTFDTAVDGLNARLACWMNGSATGAFTVGRPARLDRLPQEQAAAAPDNWYALWLGGDTVRHDQVAAAYRFFSQLRGTPDELPTGVLELLQSLPESPVLVDAVRRLARTASGPGVTELQAWLSARKPLPLWKRLRTRR